MKNANEKLNRFREGILLSFFVMLFFSFSSKSFARKNAEANSGAKIEVYSKSVSGISSVKFSFRLEQIIPVRLKHKIQDLALNVNIENKKNNFRISVLKEKFLAFKPRIFSVFLYHFFSSGDELPA